MDHTPIAIGTRTYWVSPEEKLVLLHPEDRTQHLYIVGKTGLGKSTLLRNLILQDLYAGRGVGLLDPHGDLAREVLDFVPRARTNEVLYFNPGDLAERRVWDDYQNAYEDVINSCTTAHAPWWIVPADRKWMRNLVLLETVVATLQKMKPKYPAPAVDPKKIKIE